MLAKLAGKGLTPSHPKVVQQKKAIDDTLALENADGPWKFTEIFKNEPLKIRRRFQLAIGQFPFTNHGNYTNLSPSFARYLRSPRSLLLNSDLFL